PHASKLWAVSRQPTRSRNFFMVSVLIRRDDTPPFEPCERRTPHAKSRGRSRRKGAGEGRFSARPPREQELKGRGAPRFNDSSWRGTLRSFRSGTSAYAGTPWPPRVSCPKDICAESTCGSSPRAEAADPRAAYP